MGRALRAAALCLGLLLPAVVGARPGSAGEPTRIHDSGILRVVVTQDINSIEPSLTHGYEGTQIMNATQVSLLSYSDPGTGERPHIVPYGAAALPTISTDRKTYFFKIRRGLRFSDGGRVTAVNFAEGLDRLLNPSLDSKRAFLFKHVRGAKAVMDGRAKHATGVVAKGQSLTIHLIRPEPDFMDRLAMPVVTAMPLHLPVAGGGVDAPLPSAGPYYVSRYVRRQTARLVKNRFWKATTRPARRGNVDEIVYLGRSAEAAADMVERGDADVVTLTDTTTLPPGRIRELQSRYEVNRARLWTRQRLGRMNLIFNVERPFFRHARTRRAVSFALDRQELVEAHGPLAGKLTDQLLLPGRPGFHDWKLYPPRPDLAAAKRLLRGANRHVVSMIVPDNEWGRNIADVVEENLARIDLQVNVRRLDPAPVTFMLTIAGERDWDLVAWGWSTNRDDPLAYINYPLVGKTIADSNVGRFDEHRWIRRMQRVAGLQRGRLKAYALLDRDLMQEAAPLVPYLAGNALTLFSARVGCPSWTSEGFPNIAALCLH